MGILVIIELVFKERLLQNCFEWIIESILPILSFVLSVCTVFYLYKTFESSKKALKISEDTFRLSLKGSYLDNLELISKKLLTEFNRISTCPNHERINVQSFVINIVKKHFTSEPDELLGFRTIPSELKATDILNKVKEIIKKESAQVTYEVYSDSFYNLFYNYCQQIGSFKKEFPENENDLLIYKMQIGDDMILLIALFCVLLEVCELNWKSDYYKIFNIIDNRVDDLINSNYFAKIIQQNV